MMKKIRLIAAATALASMFTLSAAAASFTPSVERKDAPEIIEKPDDLIVTPISDVYDEDKELHDDIEKSLTDAEDELTENDLNELVKGFEKAWEEATKGAPTEHAVISDLFDIRFITDLDNDEVGVEISINMKVLEIEADDVFVLLAKNGEDEPWLVLDYVISDDGVITFTATTKSVVAVVKDNEAPPAIDPDDPDSPKTGVPAHFVPAVIGVIVFATLAGACAAKASKKNLYN